MDNIHSDFPKLRVDWSGYGRDEEEICDLEQAKERVFGYATGLVVIAEDQVVSSYDDLRKLLKQSDFKNRKEFKIKPIPAMLAGG